MQRVIRLVLAVGVLILIARLSPPISALSPYEELEKPRVSTGSSILAGMALDSRVDQVLQLRPGLSRHREEVATRLTNAGLQQTAIQTGMVILGPRRRPAAVSPRHLLAQIAGLVTPRLRAESVQTELEPLGLIVADGWTDGDDSTWEGAFWGYLEDIDATFHFAVQVKIPSTQEEGAPELLRNWGGKMTSGTRGTIQIGAEVVERSVAHLVRTSLARERAAESTLKVGIREGCACSLVGSDPPALSNCLIQNAIGESWEACAIAAIGCAVTGPAWVVCVTGWCGGTFAVQLADEMIDFAWRCWFPE